MVRKKLDSIFIGGWDITPPKYSFTTIIVLFIIITYFSLTLGLCIPSQVVCIKYPANRSTHIMIHILYNLVESEVIAC